MARPIYESEMDLENEKKIINKLCDRWGLTANKLPISDKIDYHLTDPVTNKECWVEIKKRDLFRKTFNTFIISEDKWKTGQALAKINNAQFYIFVWYKDGVYWTEETNTSREVDIGGRTDRNDPKDVEKVVHIPTAEMKKLFTL